MTDKEKRERQEQERQANRGLAQRTEDARTAHRLGGPRAGVRAYCVGNRWLEENARAVGNW